MVSAHDWECQGRLPEETPLREERSRMRQKGRGILDRVQDVHKPGRKREQAPLSWSLRNLLELGH